MFSSSIWPEIDLLHSPSPISSWHHHSPSYSGCSPEHHLGLISDFTSNPSTNHLGPHTTLDMPPPVHCEPLLQDPIPSSLCDLTLDLSHYLLANLASSLFLQQTRRSPSHLLRALDIATLSAWNTLLPERKRDVLNLLNSILCSIIHLTQQTSSTTSSQWKWKSKDTPDLTWNMRGETLNVTMLDCHVVGRGVETHLGWAPLVDRKVDTQNVATHYLL